MHWSVNGIESKVQKPWLFAMALDERYGFFPKGIGGVIQHFDGLIASQYPLGFKVAVRTSQEPEELLKTPARRTQVRGVPKMPFTDQGCLVPDLLQSIC
jgi:hypothetical protein